MNKFISFEMVFENGSTYMGNKIIPLDSIESTEDIMRIEKEIKTSINYGMISGDEKVVAVTLVNWKAL